MDLTLTGITKHYPGLAALDGVDLAVASGELLALLGPSGSGKTTLLRVIAGLLSPDAGTVRFGDRDATHLSLRERQVGFVFQHYALFRHMSVADNIAFGLRSRPRRHRPPPARIAARVAELLELVQLGGLGDRLPDQLSGGQRQRVALARALAIEPSVLLLDEPFGALDAKVRVELRRWLRALHDRTGQTTLFVTHDQDEAIELADRVVLMRGGRIEQLAEPAELLGRPATPWAFDFIGRGALLRGYVGADGFQPHAGGRAWPVDAEHGPAVLGVRPHALSLGPPTDGWPGEVLAVRQAIDRVVVELRLAGDERVEVDLPPGRVPPAPGEGVGVWPASARVYPATPHALSR